jgi:hypothetical protein
MLRRGEEPMLRAYQRRKVAPKVRDGSVQKKHNHQPTAGLGHVLDRVSPAKGWRHVVTKRDIRLLTTIIPDWPTLSQGIESIVLTSSGGSYDGYYRVYRREGTGSIEIPAWEGDLWKVWEHDYFAEHRELLLRLGVACELQDDGVQCRFTLHQAKAFLLLHVFLHELGHHVDRMQTKAQRDFPRGEEFAERYANALLSSIWPAYLRVFGDPRRDINPARA